jgi:Raf kinase inhibitor-like YbhB/YbcL family protein
LMMEDPDAALKPVTHWIVANISPNVTGFPENVQKTEKYGDAVQGGNHTGKIGYFGPMPPPADKPHGYHFQIFALDTMLNLPSGFNRQALLDAMKGHVIAKGELVGMYQRKPDLREKK